jgi:hypothetical protein
MIYTRRDEKFRRSQQLSISYDKDNSGQMFEYNVYFCFLKRNRRLITHKHSKILKRCRVSVNDKHTNNPVIKFLPYPCKVCGRNLITGLTSAASPRVGISRTCKVGQKLGMSLPLLTCSPSAWPSRLLYRRCRKSRRDFWVTLFILPGWRVTLPHFVYKVYVHVP